MRKVIKNLKKLVEHLIYILILIPLIIVTIDVSYQVIFYPDKIPDIFGYKFFIIFDQYMDSSLKYGDLAITYNKQPEEIKTNDIIAFRNGANTVTINKVNKIENQNDILTFNMKTLANETNDTNDTKTVSEDKLEGLLVKRIPKLGGIIYFIQKPISMLIISCIILFVGGICIFIAGKLDEREEQKIRENVKTT